jgi:DNA invertase Pin-like site-specific DNA recombinase
MAAPGSPSTSPPTAKNEVCLYVRVSSSGQDFQGQERVLRDECRRRRWSVVAVFREKISATAKPDRREYDRLQREAAAPNRPWRHLLVGSLESFSQGATFSEGAQTIFDLEGAGVWFHSLEEPMLDTPEVRQPNFGRDFLLALLPVISSFESRYRPKPVRLAVQAMGAARKKVGSGATRGRPRRLTQPKINRIVQLRSIGLGYTKIAQRVQLPSGTCRYGYHVWRKAAHG